MMTQWAPHRGRDSEGTRAAVIDSAEKLFAERGFAATSMRDISAAAGISHPLIHHHFGSKEDLYLAVKRRVVEAYALRFPEAARASNRPLSIRVEMRRIMTFLRENKQVFRLCAWARLEGDIRAWPGEPDILDTLRARIEASQRRGRIRADMDPTTLSIMIFGLIYFWVENQDHFAQRFSGRIDDESFLQHAIGVIKQGVTPTSAQNDSE